MPRPPTARTAKRRTQPRSRRRFKLFSGSAFRRARQRGWRGFVRSSTHVQVGVGVTIVLLLWLILNWTYQVIHKPSELFFPVSGALHKAPAESWRQYGPIFRKHATDVMTPDLLAALAQVEGSGNPVVRTYWRWSLTAQPFEIYRPASSAVGMYQITDGTFAEARRYCIHDHVVVADGPWNAWHSCWFNALYTRTVPSHAVEMTSAYLDRGTTLALARFRVAKATLKQKQDLAAVIHLCGAGAGAAYVKRGLQLTPAQRCGDHDVRGYLARVHTMQRVFTRYSTRPLQ